jgi:hypothetical protein
MEISRQPDARGNQCERNRERQGVHEHAVSVIAFLGLALIFGEAQQKYDVLLVLLIARLSGLTGPDMSMPEANDGVVSIARLVRLESQLYRPVLPRSAWTDRSP